MASHACGASLSAIFIVPRHNIRVLVPVKVKIARFLLTGALQRLFVGLSRICGSAISRYSRTN